MGRILSASEALAAGDVTRRQLRTKYVKLHHNVYAAIGMELDAADRALAAWLWVARTSDAGRPFRRRDARVSLVGSGTAD